MRLIDADNLTENLAYDIANHPIHGNYKITVASVRAAIYSAPVIDAVPVVRCKDCIHLMFSDFYGECKRGYLCGIVRPDDYCSRGKRKEDNTLNEIIGGGE